MSFSLEKNTYCSVLIKNSVRSSMYCDTYCSSHLKKQSQTVASLQGEDIFSSISSPSTDISGDLV